MSEIKLKQIDTLSGGRYETWLRIMRAVYSDDGLSPTIHTCGGGNMEPKVKTKNIIRKLTPRECFRLMSFTDADFDKVKAIGISDSQCYKQAGNSIVVTVLEAIFREMIVNKLAAYEDVGLTPEEVEFLQAENARLKNDRKLFTEIHETVKSIGGKTRELLEENGQLLLENAELRARLDKAVELPCKVGDTIYAIAECENILMHYDNDWETGTGATECPFENSCEFEDCADTNRRIFETKVANFWICEDSKTYVGLVRLTRDYILSDFGKMIFLTRAEAEARLKELE
mgnify:CR=1 FL=1